MVKGKPPTPIERNYGRNPAIDGEEGDYAEMMDKVPRKAMDDQRVEKHSQMDKPYQHDDYGEMEHFYPVPSHFALPDGMSIDNLRNPVPLDGEWPAAWGWPPCILTTTGPFYCTNCDGAGGPDWIEKGETGFMVIREGYFPGKEGGINKMLTLAAPNVKIYVNGDGYGDIDVNTNRLGTSTSIDGITVIGAGKVRINAPEGGWTRGDEIYVEAWCKDEEGNKILGCTDKQTVTCFDNEKCNCCESDDYVVMTLDTVNTPETIAAGDSAIIYVLDGCEDYTYEVSGTGYTWNSNGSTTLVSSSKNEQLDCAAGSCGVDYDVTASITITDDCGTVIGAGSTVLRNITGGSWVQRGILTLSEWATSPNIDPDVYYTSCNWIDGPGVFEHIYTLEGNAYRLYIGASDASYHACSVGTTVPDWKLGTHNWPDMGDYWVSPGAPFSIYMGTVSAYKYNQNTGYCDIPVTAYYLGCSSSIYAYDFYVWEC